MAIRLVRPTLKLKDAALAFRQEFFDNGETVINGSELFDEIESYEEWLDMITKNTDPATVHPEWVVTDTYFAMDEAGEIVGIIDLRHTLKDWLIDFGNCGYSVRPTMRGHGYATQMLRLVIERAKEIGLTELHFSTKPENKISQKTILRCGGEYERSFEYEDGIGYAYRLTLI